MSDISAQTKELISRLGFGQIMEVMLLHSRPKTEEEAVDMIASLMAGLTAIIAWQAFQHINQHEGYDCARGIIEDMGDLVAKDSYDALNVVLKMKGLPPMDEDVNAQTTREILKEMDNDP